VRAEAEERPRRLIETLAEDIAGVVLTRYPVKEVEVEVRKYIVEGTGWVGVRIERSRSGG
jgi:phosphoglycolate phosphatase/dihydroneopterin aldolase